MEGSGCTKHIVLVHNACHGAWVWFKVKTMLVSAGYRVTAPELAGSGRDDRPIRQVVSVTEYSQPLLDVLHNLPTGERVILVGHTIGGMTIALAMEMYPQKIAAAVFVASFMPDTKFRPSYVVEKYLESAKGPSYWMDCVLDSYVAGEKEISSMFLGPNFLRSRLYQNSSQEDFTLATSLVREGSFFLEDLKVLEPFSKEKYGSVDKVYIISGQDLAVPVKHQHWMIENNPVKEVITIETADHMVMLSAPKELSKCLADVANRYL